MPQISGKWIQDRFYVEGQERTAVSSGNNAILGNVKGKTIGVAIGGVACGTCTF